MATYEWPESLKGKNVMWKLPRNIRLNDNIVVREDEIAVFYRDGKALAYFDRPDRYALTSLDVPYVSRIVEFLTGVRQDAEVYYIQKRPFDAKFGSRQPYAFRDPDFGIVNLRLFGQVRWRVKNPANFINQFVGTEGLVTGPRVEERIREQVVMAIFDVLGEMKARGVSVLDIPANLMEIEQVVLEKSRPNFDPYGIDVQKISGLTITLPEEVQKAVDARSAMHITGTGYMQYQTAQSMREAAANPAGGGAGAGVGIGAGIGMGYQMANVMAGSQQQQPPPTTASRPCVKCGASVPQGNRFCGQCGAQQPGASRSGSGFCTNCGTALASGAKFCGQCGARVT